MSLPAVSRRSRVARRISVVFAGLLLAALVAEGALRLAGRLYLGNLYSASERPAADGEITVVCLGESSTFGLWLPPDQSYPRQLERALRRAYGRKDIRVIVPPHVGQNTSQMANRIGDYVRRYRPRLVVAMAGYNNEWSLAESHLGEFLPPEDRRGRRLRLLVALDGLRLWKVVRNLSLRATRENAPVDWKTAAGHPELVPYPPEPGVYAVARDNPAALVKLWRHDMLQVSRAVRRSGGRLLLMSYHINPSYLPAEEMAAFGHEEEIPVVRNDLTFRRFADNGTLGQYLFHDGWHPKQNGYALIAAGALRAILAQDLLGLGGLESGKVAHALPEPHFPELSQPVAVGSWSGAGFLGVGWSWPEGEFRWTDGPVAEIVFGSAKRSARMFRMRARAYQEPAAVKTRHVEVRFNGREIDRWELSAATPFVRGLALPPDALQTDNVLLFRLPDAKVVADGRRLTLAVESIWLDDVAQVELGHAIRMGVDEAEPFLVSGWSWGEGKFRWSDGPRAGFAFRTRAAPAAVVIRAQPFVGPAGIVRQRVVLTLNGRPIGTWVLTDPAPRTYRMALPPAVLGAEIVLDLEFPDAASPHSIGLSGDARRLAVAVDWIRLEGPAAEH